MKVMFDHQRQKGLMLDPRTKLLMLITLSTLMLSTGNGGIMKLIKPIMAALPFLLLLCSQRFLDAAKYIIFYSLCFYLEQLLLKQGGGVIHFILLAGCAVMTRFAPGMMMGAFLITTTSVSEFISSMKRMHMPDQITIPLSVIFRFFPTIAQEYSAISDAMRMRGIRLGGTNPLAMIEYRLVPLMMSTVKIGEELSAAALTRGLASPEKRTNVCQIGFQIQDYLLMFICILCFTGYLFRSKIRI